MNQDLFIKTFVSERFAINILSDYHRINKKNIRHLTAEKGNSKIDLMLNNKTYDVKYSNPTLTNSSRTTLVWDFDIRGKKDYCDFLLLIGMIKGRPLKVFLVPGLNIPAHHVRISINGESKYHKYLIWSK